MSGDFGRVKTLALVKANLYWPKVQRDVARFVFTCKCMMAKTISKNASLYTSLPIPNAP